MKTVTQDFVDAQKAPAPFMVRQVWYKRRSWQESTKSYIWETNWTQYTEDNVVDVSEITWQLDIQTLSEFKTSNVTLTLQNLNNQWNPENPYGVFKKDAVSPVFGYLSYWTKFQIRAGLQFGASETVEVVPIFTGLATDYNLDSATGQIQINLTGEEALLVGSNAEAVSTSIVNETLTGTVDGSNKVFTTAHTAVGIWAEASDNGIAKRAGADYAISNLNLPTTVATITFIVAPAAGHTIRGSYLYWKTSQKFEDLVTDLLNQAGIPGGNQQVSPVVFSSSIINTHVWQTQADWNGGSLSFIDSVSIPNSIQYLYSAASSINSTTSGWTYHQFSTNGNFSSDSSGLVFSAGTPQVYNSVTYQGQTNTVGDWICSFSGDSANTSHADNLVWHFMANAVDLSNVLNYPYMYQGYSIEIGLGAMDSPNCSVQLMRNDTSHTGRTSLIYAPVTLASGTTSFTIKVRRRPGGAFVLYVNGVIVGTAADNTYTTSTYQGYSLEFNQNHKCHIYNNGFSLPTGSTNPGQWISGAVDFGSTPTAWAQFQFSQSLSGGATTYYTRSSADNITYDSWVVVPSNGIVGSTLRRYIEARADIDITSGDPIVSSITVGATTASTVVSMANFTGMTCYGAIQALGQFANYEFGFDANENFFFRPKNPGNSPVFSFTESTFNTEILSKVTGDDQVFSKVRASYGAYIVDISDDGLMYQDPLPSYGFNLQQISGGSILVSSDADIATGVAGSFFNFYRLPRRRVKARTICIPQLDISDVINCAFQDLQPNRWFIGDTSTFIGDTTKSLYGPEEQVLAPLNMKVVGMRINTNDWFTEFDFQEVLS